jgi:hypothetical protein
MQRALNQASSIAALPSEDLRALKEKVISYAKPSLVVFTIAAATL